MNYKVRDTAQTTLTPGKLVAALVLCSAMIPRLHIAGLHKLAGARVCVCAYACVCVSLCMCTVFPSLPVVHVHRHTDGVSATHPTCHSIL